MNLLNNIFYFIKMAFGILKSQFPGHHCNIKPEIITQTWTNIPALSELNYPAMQRLPGNLRQIHLGQKFKIKYYV